MIRNKRVKPLSRKWVGLWQHPLVKLAARESNVSALRLDQRFGFKRIRSKKQKLSDQDNAVVMMAATRNTSLQPPPGHAMRADL